MNRRPTTPPLGYETVFDRRASSVPRPRAPLQRSSTPVVSRPSTTSEGSFLFDESTRFFNQSRRGFRSSEHYIPTPHPNIPGGGTPEREIETRESLQGRAQSSNQPQRTISFARPSSIEKNTPRRTEYFFEEGWLERPLTSVPMQPIMAGDGMPRGPPVVAQESRLRTTSYKLSELGLSKLEHEAKRGEKIFNESELQSGKTPKSPSAILSAPLPPPKSDNAWNIRETLSKVKSQVTRPSNYNDYPGTVSLPMRGFTRTTPSPMPMASYERKELQTRPRRQPSLAEQLMKERDFNDEQEMIKEYVIPSHPSISITPHDGFEQHAQAYDETGDEELDSDIPIVVREEVPLDFHEDLSPTVPDEEHRPATPPVPTRSRTVIAEEKPSTFTEMLIKRAKEVRGGSVSTPTSQPPPLEIPISVEPSPRPHQLSATRAQTPLGVTDDSFNKLKEPDNEHTRRGSSGSGTFSPGLLSPHVKHGHDLQESRPQSFLTLGSAESFNNIPPEAMLRIPITGRSPRSPRSPRSVSPSSPNEIEAALGPSSSGVHITAARASFSSTSMLSFNRDIVDMAEQVSDVGEESDKDDGLDLNRILEPDDDFRKISDYTPDFTRGRSFFIFGRDNPIRQLCIKFCTSWQAEVLVISLIVLNCIAVSQLNHQRSRTSFTRDVAGRPLSTIAKLARQIDVFFLGVFIFEALIKCIAKGFILPENYSVVKKHKSDEAEGSYLSDNWNRMEFMMLGFQILSRLAPSVGMLRVIRALRPVRLASKINELLVILEALVDSLKPIINVIVLFVIVFFYFGLAGLDLYAGKLNYCTIDPGSDENVNVQADCVGTTFTYPGDTPPYIGILSPRSWETPDSNFDNIFSAVLMCIEIASLSDWVARVQPSLDARGKGLQPVVDASPLNTFFFILCTAVCSFYIISVFVGVVIIHINAQTGNDLMTSQQRMWQAWKKSFSFTSPLRTPVPKNNSISRWAFLLVEYPRVYVDIKQFRTEAKVAFEVEERRRRERLLREDLSDVRSESVFSGSHSKVHKGDREYLASHGLRLDADRRIGAECRKQRSRGSPLVIPYFDRFMTAVLLLNAASICATVKGMSPDSTYSITLGRVNIMIIVIFVIEFILKLTAYGASYYFSIPSNAFEFFVTCASVVSYVIISFGGELSIFISIPTRTVPTLRMLRLIRSTRNLQYLFNALVVTLPTLFRISFMLLLLMYTYAVVGTVSFAHLKFQRSIMQHANFRNFRSAMIIMFRLVTLDNWNNIMRDCTRSADDGDCTQDSAMNDCGSTWAYIFFLSFFIVGSYVFLNLVIAIILPHFSADDEKTNMIQDDDLAHYQLVWMEMDPMGTGKLPRYKWYHLVHTLLYEGNPLVSKLSATENGMRYKVATLLLDIEIAERVMRESEQRGVSYWYNRIIKKNDDKNVDFKKLDDSAVIQFQETLKLIGKAAIGSAGLSFYESREEKYRFDYLKEYIAYQTALRYMRRYLTIVRLYREMDKADLSRLRKIRRNVQMWKKKEFINQCKNMKADAKQFHQSQKIEEAQRLIQQATEDPQRYAQQLKAVLSRMEDENLSKINFSSITQISCNLPPAITRAKVTSKTLGPP